MTETINSQNDGEPAETERPKAKSLAPSNRKHPRRPTGPRNSLEKQRWSAPTRRLKSSP